jgi:hypothetical protein
MLEPSPPKDHNPEDYADVIAVETSRLRSLTGQSLSRAGKISSCVNWLSAREKIGPVNEPLTSQSTCLFNRFAPLFGEVTIGRLTDQIPRQGF